MKLYLVLFLLVYREAKQYFIRLLEKMEVLAFSCFFTCKDDDTHWHATIVAAKIKHCARGVPYNSNSKEERFQNNLRNISSLPSSHERGRARKYRLW